MLNKKCSSCQVLKPTSDFYPRSGRSGFRSRCKQCESEKKKSEYWEDADATRSKRNAARDANPSVRARERAYYQANRDQYAARQSEALKLFPEVFSARRQARRALLRGASGSHTPEQVSQLMKKQRFRCACCRASLAGGYHEDHIIALVNGGSNDILNIQLLCGPCNLSKGAKDPIAFMNERGFLL